MKKIILLLISFILAACLPVTPQTSELIPSTPTPTVLTSSDQPQPPDRSMYRELEIKYDLSDCRSQQETANEPSIQNSPSLLGMCVAGYPNMDESVPSLVQIFYITSDTVVVIVTTDGVFVAGDSVRSSEIRVDLAYSTTQGWSILWKGGRWKCKSGRGHQDWGNELCS